MFPLTFFAEIALYGLAAYFVNGNEWANKIVAFGCLMLAIPLQVVDPTFIIDNGSTLSTATVSIGATLQSSFVLVTVFYAFLVLIHTWNWARADEE